MKWRDWLEQWGMKNLKINLHFLQMEWQPNDPDRHAAWDLYIELLTRITAQALPAEHGDEATALKSVSSLFPTTREILRRHGSGCNEFAKIAIVVLNQIVRPFTTKWHRLSGQGAFGDPGQCAVFRQELEVLQGKLRTYTGMLSQMAAVEDLTNLEVT